MDVPDFFAGEIATELLKMLFTISRKSCLCKISADQLIVYINELLPLIQEIKYSGVELSAIRQSQLDRISEVLREGIDLANKVLNSRRWNVYKNLQLAKKMEKLEKKVSRFVSGPMQAHILADIHHMRFEAAQRFDRLEGSAQNLELRLAAMRIEGGWMQQAVRRVEEDERWESDVANMGKGLEEGKRKVKELIVGRDDLGVVGICGIGGSGKTTLARELVRDEQVRNYFNGRIIFLTVSQSPNLDQLCERIRGFTMGADATGFHNVNPPWKPQLEWRTGPRVLVVLDDVWSVEVLSRLICRVPGCKALVVSRFKFPSVFNAFYEIELMKEAEAVTLFCRYAFGQPSVPLGANEKLVRQIVNECRGLPLALKVIGASLRDQSERYWASARNRLSRGQTICEAHESQLLERMAISVQHLHGKVRDCFLDMASFPEDTKVPLDILISTWVETHDIDEEEAFAVLVELTNKNLLTLVKDSRVGDIYSGYYEISVAQHDVLRDLALHLNSHGGNINDRRRLFMPQRETELPREWERTADQPFNAQIVSVHTGEMNEMDWFQMEFPRAEVLIINFSSREYFLPPFIGNMPKLRSLIVINHGSANATLRNLSVLDELTNLRSLWFEKVAIPSLSMVTNPLKELRKMSLVLCRVDNCFDQSVYLPHLFPLLSELVIDHCDDLMELPPSVCEMQSMRSLSITNCPNLCKLPANFCKLRSLQILRLNACPNLKALPSEICQLALLNYLDISQCVNLRYLPEDMGKLVGLEKIDMRECLQITSLPKSVVSLKTLRTVICDEEASFLWRDLEKAMQGLLIQVAEKSFGLDWLDD